jgi:hypothetical protein
MGDLEEMLKITKEADKTKWALGQWHRLYSVAAYPTQTKVYATVSPIISPRLLI